MKFRKRPVVIEAWQNSLTSSAPNWVTDVSLRTTDGLFLIRTLEGTMKANLGDWIIQGVNGEVYPCKPDIFEKTYERVDE